LKESIHINTGLLALGNVISALADPAKRRGHVPYREAKITRLLKDALGGSSRTLMVCCVSPALSSYDESLNSLKYANRAKHIRNKPIVHRDKLSAHLHEMQSEILALREQLGRAGTSAGGPDSAWASAGGDEARLRFELDHLRCLADRARALLSGDPRAADWMEMYDELGNKVPSLPDDSTRLQMGEQKQVDTEQHKKLQQDLEKARQDLANDEEIFAEKSREAWALGDRCRALEAELAAANSKAAYLESKLIEKQQQQLEDLNEANGGADVGGDASASGAGPARAQSVPARHRTEQSLLQQSLLMLPADRAVRTSPGLFDLDRVLRSCRARSELLFAQLDDSDSALCHRFEDVENAKPDNGEQKQQQQQQQQQSSPFVRKGTFRLHQQKNGDKASSASSASVAAAGSANSGANDEAKRQLKASQMKLAEANQKVRDLQLNINMKEQLIRDLVKSSKQTAQVNHKYEEQARQLALEQQACEREQREAQARLDELASARRSNASVGSLSRLKAEHEAKLAECAERMRDIRARLEEAQRLAGITGSGRERRVAELESALDRMRAELSEARGQLAAEADAKKRLEAESQRRGTGGAASAGSASKRTSEEPVDERTAWLDAEVEKAVKQRQELRQLEDELRSREAILSKREALLAERAECEMTSMRAGGAESGGSDRLQELDEALAALDEALGLRNEAISAREGGLRQSQLSLSTSQDALFTRLGALSASEAKRLVAANFRRLVQLRSALAEEESRRAEARLRLDELAKDKERLERSLQRANGETERRITRLQSEYEAQIQLLVDRLSTAEAEAARLPQTERELAVYKKTSRELKRKIRDWVSSGRLLNAAPADLDEVAASSSHRQSVQQPPQTPQTPQTPHQQQQQQSSSSRPTSVRVSRKEVRELSAEQLSARGSQHRQSAGSGAAAAAAASIVHDSLDDD
uniref:Kinesin motor domain-containing protein n=1 Tax=Macrostomum lignano TaxID=282301 RepID=A0A1I8GH55_9PLAT